MINKRGDVIASAVTNLDLHDISRAARTFGVKSFYVVTPLLDQIELVERLLSHWRSGAGADYNPDRREALELIRTVEDLQEAQEEIAAGFGRGLTPRTVVTTARAASKTISFRRLRELIFDGAPWLFLFGTAWGLAEAVIRDADYTLESIEGISGYNHLSVRSAVSIVLDRLVGRRT